MNKFLTSIFLLSFFNLNAQDQILQKSDLAEAEFSVAINPTDTNNIVVATMHGFSDVTDSYFSIYYTRDFGRTWEKSAFDGTHNMFAGAGDPVLSYNADGDLVLVNLVVTSAIEQRIPTILSVSKDGGETWEFKSDYGEFYTDKPWINIDTHLGSPHYGKIYVPTVVDEVHLLSYNEQYELLTDTTMPGGEHIPSVVVARNGDLFVSNMTFGAPTQLFVQHYTDAGRTLVSSNLVTEFPSKLFSGDGQISQRFQPSPYLAIDNTDGPYAGRLYYAYTASDQANDDLFDVFLTYSDDKGITWSEPATVHEDAVLENQQYYSSIYVNDQGVLLIDFYDRSRHDPLSNLTDFILGMSFDGGESFSEIKLNSEPMDFTSVFNAGFGFGIGEYHQVVATDYAALSFWSDGRTNDGDLNIYYSVVDINNPISSVQEHGLINDKISVSKVYPLPATDRINVDLKLDKGYDVKVQIFDLTGALLLDLNQGRLQAGDHTLAVPLDLVSGNYIFNLKTDTGFFRSKQFSVLKP